MMTVPQIVEHVFGEGVRPYSRKVEPLESARTPLVCKTRMQYDESDLDFCHRLLEDEGISYRFEQRDGAEAVCLDDNPASRQAALASSAEEYELATFAGAGGGQESILSLGAQAKVRLTKVALRAYDWTRPMAGLTDEQEVDPKSVAGVGPEREDYQHDLLPPTLTYYDTNNRAYGPDDVDHQTAICQELRAQDAMAVQGSGTVTGLRAKGKS